MNSVAFSLLSLCAERFLLWSATILDLVKMLSLQDGVLVFFFFLVTNDSLQWRAFWKSEASGPPSVKHISKATPP